MIGLKQPPKRNERTAECRYEARPFSAPRVLFDDADHLWIKYLKSYRNCCYGRAEWGKVTETETDPERQI